jgi:hypothetical protein
MNFCGCLLQRILLANYCEATKSCLDDPSGNDEDNTKSRSITADRHREQHSFLRCCYDCRRATIVVNVIGFVVALFFLLAQGSIMMDKNSEISHNALLAGMVIVSVALVMNTIEIYGAINYKTWAVMV